MYIITYHIISYDKNNSPMLLFIFRNDTLSVTAIDLGWSSETRPFCAKCALLQPHLLYR